MRPFGQWLNDCGGSPAKEPTNEPEIDRAYVDEFDAAVQRGGIDVVCRCYKCDEVIDPRKYGVSPESVTDGDNFLCDDCWTAEMDGDIGMDGDGAEPSWENGSG